MPKHKSDAKPDGMIQHHKRFDPEKLKSGRAMMEDIKEVDQTVVAGEEVKQVDMSKDPDKKGEEWQ